MSKQPNTAQEYIEKLQKMNRPAWVQYAKAYWLFLTTSKDKPNWQTNGLQYERYAAEIERNPLSYKDQLI